MFTCHRRGSRTELSGTRTDPGRNSGKLPHSTDEAIPAHGRIFQVYRQSAPLLGALCFILYFFIDKTEHFPLHDTQKGSKQ